jgi:uncharacterized protein involved in exopolysaccharide biosynthesis
VTSSEGSYDYSDAQESETGETPPGQPFWRRPIISLTLGLFAFILLGLAIFLLADKTSEHSGTTQTPTSPTAPVTAPAAPTT